MSRLLPLLVAVLVVAVGAAYFLNRGDQEAVVALEVGDRTNEDNATRASELSAPLALRDTEATTSLEGTPAASGSQRENAQLGEWVEGTVDVPFGSPPEELGVFVFASEYELGRRAWHMQLEDDRDAVTRVPVQDGRFRFRATKGVASNLWLDSQWLYLEDSVHVPNGSVPHLQAMLGAALEVTAYAPPGALDDEPLEGVQVWMVGSPPGDPEDWISDELEQRPAQLDAAGRALFRGLQTNLIWSVRSMPPYWMEFAMLGLQLQPAQLAHQDVIFKLGARLQGRVVDPTGRPVEGAQVAWQTTRGFFDNQERKVLSNIDGEFLIRGLDPGRGDLVATSVDHQPAPLQRFELENGTLLNSLELVLSAGEAVEGYVRLPSGEPAKNARVGVELLAEQLPQSYEWPSREERAHQLRTDAQGHFRFEGLMSSVHMLQVRWKAPDGETWRASFPEVEAGTTGLQLVVRPAVGMYVRVVDSLGAPIRDSKVKVTQSPERNAARYGLGSFASAKERRGLRSRKVGEDGRHFIENVWHGTWYVYAEAPNYVQPEEALRIEVTRTAEVTVHLSRMAAVSGIVLDPLGNPVSRASVTLMDSLKQSNSKSAKTDESGHFSIGQVPPGSYELWAKHDEFATSAIQGIELNAHDAKTDLRLQLQAGGAIHGIVYGSDGSPAAGLTIEAGQTFGRAQRGTVSDAEGRFQLEGLAAGKYQVIAQPEYEFGFAEPRSSRDVSADEMMRELKITTAVVVDGEITEVVLGGRPGSPVRVFGRVTRAGVAARHGSIAILREGGSMLDALDSASVQADGSYVLQVNGHGPATLVFTDDMSAFGGWSQPIDIPEQSEWRCDVELPAGRLHGLVVSKLGPLQGVTVMLDPHEAVTHELGFGLGNSTRTDARGRFEFESLTAGVYDLRVMTVGLDSDSREPVARVVSGITIDTNELTEITVEIEAGGTLVGRAIDAEGNPQARASIFVRDATGQLVSRISMVESDANGHFSHPGLPPGELFVESRTPEGASQPVAVQIVPGEEAEVVLRVIAGTLLTVHAENSAGEPTRMRLTVVDSAGREHAAMRSRFDLETGMTSAIDNTRRTVGPLPPGKYTVTAFDYEGREKRRTVTLKAARERVLRLRFAGD